MPDSESESIYSGLWGHVDTYHRFLYQVWSYLQYRDLHTSYMEFTACNINAQQSTATLYAKGIRYWSPQVTKELSGKSYCGWSLDILPWYRLLNPGFIMGGFFILRHDQTNGKIYDSNGRSIHAYTECTEYSLWSLREKLGDNGLLGSWHDQETIQGSDLSVRYSWGQLYDGICPNFKGRVGCNQPITSEERLCFRGEGPTIFNAHPLSCRWVIKCVGYIITNA